MTDTASSNAPVVASAHPWLRVERHGEVQTVTLANPSQRNAMTPSLWRALAHVATHTPDEVRVVVLRGEGASFCAGLHRQLLAPGGLPDEDDMLAIAARGQRHAVAMIEEYQRGFTLWAHLPAVVVAAVQGHAIGAGFQLALAADLRVAADDAQFAMRETSLGMVPDLGGTSPLVHAVGYSRALEICATGRFVGAQEARDIGLVNLLVPGDGLDAGVGQVVDGLLAAPDLALRALKPLLRQAAGATPQEQQAAEREANARLLSTMARAAPQDVEALTRGGTQE
ncbi:MAG: enoyl-CoA hydratase/isomerase family protein [Actinomycetota bacterium]|nr:enoyl-CoA hydratase/isomerase family protein [Actinomycetota bacterium]